MRKLMLAATAMLLPLTLNAQVHEGLATQDIPYTSIYYGYPRTLTGYYPAWAMHAGVRNDYAPNTYYTSRLHERRWVGPWRRSAF